MADLTSRLEGLRGTIEQLMRIGGTPGLSLGVMQPGGRVVYEAHFGYRDIKNKKTVNNETIFPICSLTKAITAAAIGVLVQEGHFSWDTLIKDVLPSFRPRDDILYECLSITDILSHRSGMTNVNSMVVGSEGNILIPGRDTMRLINTQSRQLPFRQQYAYNNLPYELAGEIIKEVTGTSWADFVQTRILKSYKLNRTFCKPPPPDTENVAQCYNTLEDLTAAPVPGPGAGKDGFAGPSGGMRSCTRDLLNFYGMFFMHHFQYTSGRFESFDVVAYLTSSKIPMEQTSRYECSYACGWARVQLPGRMGQIGINYGKNPLPDGTPVVGKGVPSQPVLFHQGSFPGALAIAILLPDTDTVIVVLTNSLALTDVADWVGQLVLEEVLDVPQDQRVEDLNKSKGEGTSPRALKEYVGKYRDEADVYKIVVVLEDSQLHWLLQGLDSEKFPLQHWQDDTFTWLLPRTELSRRGRWVGWEQGPEFWKARFEADDGGSIKKLYWAHDPGAPPLELIKDESMING